MAQLPSGILSVPRGKLSSSVWIHPRTGVVYSPPPKHVDKKTPLQLYHRRKMRTMAPVLRWFAKNVSKPVWGARIKYLTPYSFAVGLSLPLFQDYDEIKNLRVLMLFDRWWAPYWLGGAMGGSSYAFQLRPLPESLAGRDVRYCFTAYTTAPFRTKTTGWIPYVPGVVPGFFWPWRDPDALTGMHFISAYQEESGLWIYVGESVNYYFTSFFV